MKKFFTTLIFSFIYLAAAHAAPPSNLTLDYDLDSGTLTAQGSHPTQDRFEHYIRRMMVTKNQEEPQTFYFTRQNSAGEFKQTVSLKIKAGDKIHVQVYCSLGGSSEADLVIPDEKKIDGIKKIDLKALKDQDHKNSVVIP